MNKEEIIDRLMESEYWEGLYIDYARKGLMGEKKSILLKLLKENKGEEQ